MDEVQLELNLFFPQNNIVSHDSLEVFSSYIESLQNPQLINDTKNALIRYFIPSVDGPIPEAKKRRPISEEDTEKAFNFLKTVPLETLANAPDFAKEVLRKVDSSPSQKERVRANLRALVDWAREQKYLPRPRNPIPIDLCAHIKVGQYKALNLKSASARQIFEEYLERVTGEDAEDVSNAIVRFFVPGCRGPEVLHKPAKAFEIEAALNYLENVPLEYLNEATHIASAVLEVYELTPDHGTRIRHALRGLINWARREKYLPDPKWLTPWGEEYLPPSVKEQEQQKLLESYEKYCRYLEDNGKGNQINSLKTLVVRYVVPALDGPIPKSKKATGDEVNAALSYLQKIPLEQLQKAVDLVEVEFERLNIPPEKRSSPRSRLRGWVTFTTRIDTTEKEEEQPVFNTFRTVGVRREVKKMGMKMQENRTPVHALCAKQFPKDYINPYLEKQLRSYEKWRQDNGVAVGSIKTEKEQMLQLLGWLHRYQDVPLDSLCFEKMITKTQLIFRAKEYEDYHKYLYEKEIGIQAARDQADLDKERVQNYLMFTGKNPTSQLRRLFIALSIAKFLYRDLLGSDDFSSDRDIPVLRRLLDLQSTLKKKSKVTPQTMNYGETSVPWEKAIEAMKKEWERVDAINVYVKERSRQGYRVQRRRETALANDLQRFLSIALLLLIVGRSRTYYDLRIGETFAEGILEERIFISVDDIKKRGTWEKDKDRVGFYIHQRGKDFKTGKSMTPALLESDGWWSIVPNIQFKNACLYDYICRWLDWGRALTGDMEHNFFFRTPYGTTPLDVHAWQQRIQKIFQRWTGVPVPPKNVRKMFTSQFPEHAESAAILLQHSEKMHLTHYDMRQTVDKIQPVMEANVDFIQTYLYRGMLVSDQSRENSNKEEK